MKKVNRVFGKLTRDSMIQHVNHLDPVTIKAKINFQSVNINNEYHSWPQDDIY